MAVDTSIIGKPTERAEGARRARPGGVLRHALKDDNPVYHDAGAAAAAGFDGIPAPPTFSFVMGHMGARAEEQPPDPSGGQSPMFQVMGDLMSKGGLVLHGEQEFVYHRPIVEGDVLAQRGPDRRRLREGVEGLDHDVHRHGDRVARRVGRPGRHRDLQPHPPAQSGISAAR